MSRICGIFHLDGSPIEPEQLNQMAEAAAYNGLDGPRIWTEKNAGLAHLALHTTPEARFEQQPMRDPHTGAIWAADARVDNRAELIEFFRKTGDIMGDEIVTDIELLIYAYRHWGEDFLPHIYGNYAFVMWDPARQRVFAGRDFLGLRPLFYMRRGQTVYFASVLRSILAILPERPPLNELLIADYYRYNFERWVAETVYLPIRRLPAACQVVVDAQRADIKQHWMIVNGPILQYQNDQDYYDEFLERFESALKACARTADPLGIQLSGGVDSSSVVCVLHKLWVENRLQGGIPPSVHLLYMHYANERIEDEIEYYDTVSKACPQFVSTVLPGENYWGLQEAGRENNYRLDEPELQVMRSSATALARRLRQEGGRVALQGSGGDELFEIYYTDIKLLRDLPFAKWPKAFKFSRQFMGPAGNLRLAGRAILQVAGLLPAWRRLRGAFPRWVRQEWVRKAEANPPDFKLAIPDGFSNELQRIRQDGMFTGGQYLSGLQGVQYHAAEHGLEVRCPFLDRSLIEFTFRLPTERLMNYESVFKPFLKAALRGILPDAITKRTDHAVVDPTIHLGLRNKEAAKASRLLDRARAEQIDFLKFFEYNAHWKRYTEGVTRLQGALFAPLLFQAWMDDSWHEVG
ncbi:MAG: Asparagine synthetase [glutamine-hydrolyzing] 1 [Anaerolineales bacterium]|nr:Asparagine synthetase [glutamine-hydrolyzing] 1 [Anaerolineales bacterium]